MLIAPQRKKGPNEVRVSIVDIREFPCWVFTCAVQTNMVSFPVYAAISRLNSPFGTDYKRAPSVGFMGMRGKKVPLVSVKKKHLPRLVVF